MRGAGHDAPVPPARCWPDRPRQPAGQLAEGKIDVGVGNCRRHTSGGVLFRDAERRRPSFRLAAMPQGLPTPTVAVIEAVDHKGVVPSASTTRPCGSLRGALGGLSYDLRRPTADVRLGVRPELLLAAAPATAGPGSSPLPLTLAGSVVNPCQPQSRDACQVEACIDAGSDAAASEPARSSARNPEKPQCGEAW
jgi:hypothetical protein